VIHTDKQTRLLYSSDASMYEEVPQGVSFPSSTDDIQSLVRRAREEGFSITARSAGTSLAGQATGDGVIMDVSRHMTELMELNAEQRFAQVQPGVIRDTLNRQAAEHGLLFGPDTSTTNRCMIGGMIGNNSTGSFSIKHGSTREHVLEVEAVLSDGSTAVFGPLTSDELEAKKQLDSLEGRIYRGMLELIEEHSDTILEAYPHPEIIRRNTGYALDKLCTMQPFDPDGRPFNLAELLCGSEGTLAMTASAKIRLVPRDSERVLLIPQFDSLREALEATVDVVQYDPAAAELIDDIVLGATKDNIEQRKNRFFLEGEPRSVLIIQFEGNDKEALIERAEKLRDRLQQNKKGYVHPIIEDDDKIERVWDLRKAGLGLLMGLDSDSRTPSFVEDTAVRVQDLPDYIDEFQALLNKYNTRCVFYAHASVGELHIRPVVDTLTDEGVDKMKQMANEVADLVASYNGSLSGEHGDGRARSPYIEKVLGADMMPLLRRTKELWDPDYLFNPGKIVEPRPINDHLRFSPEYRRPQVDTVFEWRKEGSFADALELCNGAGVCRKLAESGGTMCPSYMATKEEKDSTRGRANLFRQLFEGKQAEAFSSEELNDALDLCLSCKACKSECPANVDMARMKAEFMNGWHRRNGISWSERFFGQAAKFYPLAQKLAPLVNQAADWGITKQIMYRLFNIAPERSLPIFARETFFQRWEEELKPDEAQLDEAGQVLLEGSGIPDRKKVEDKDGGDNDRGKKQSEDNDSRKQNGDEGQENISGGKVEKNQEVDSKGNDENVDNGRDSEEQDYGVDLNRSGTVEKGSNPREAQYRIKQEKITKVALFVDLFTNYHDPDIAEAAVRVLRRLGYDIKLIDQVESGRPQLSKGLVDQVKPLVNETIPRLHEYVRRHVPIVGIEPSEVLTFRDDYPDLCGEEQITMAQKVAANTYQFEEFLLRHENVTDYFQKTDQTVYVHGHCHAKALVGMEPTLQLLSEGGYLPVDLQTGCCGMAGSFGYEADHYNVSMDIGELRLFPQLRETEQETLICAPGFSCRHQIKDGVGRTAYHPAQLMASHLG